MIGCTEKVLDLFVTKDSVAYQREFDDVFMGPVWSIEIEGESTAVVVNKSTPWVTWCKYMERDPGLEVGDLVRVGTTGTEGHTGLCTVLQKLKLSEIKNGVTHDGLYNKLQLPAVDLKTTELAEASTEGDRVVAGEALSITEDWYAYRLNFAFNLTMLTGTPLEVQHLQRAVLADALFENRHTFRHSNGVVGTDAEKMYYPLYKVKRWLTSTGEIQVNLDHGVRKVRWIKLVGYSVFDKRQSGFQNAHEASNDDWVAMRIKNVDGEVVSNNVYAHGSFAILHMGGQRDNQSGAIEYHTHDTEGISTLRFDGGMMRELNLRFTDRNGDPAHFGRIHLWLKVGVNHG